MIVTILVFIIVLSILVFVHELGHFSVAKKLGIGVEEFGFGLPPRIWGVKKGETLYSLNLLPIGGFVRLTGEDEDPASLKLRGASKKELKRYFWARSKKERAAVLLAGVIMNFSLAVIIISYIFTQGVLVPTSRVHIDRVESDTPAQEAGLQEGDVISRVDELEISSADDLIAVIDEHKGKEVVLTILRDDTQLSTSITPRIEYPEDQGSLGVAISSLEEKKYPWYQAPFLGIAEAVKMSLTMLVLLGELLWRLVTLQGLGGFDIAGPVGIAQVTGQAAQSGVQAVLGVMGLLSLNLAILNVLPIPALDGGRLMFVILEKFIGRKVKPKFERIAHQVGMAFLLALFLLVTINDILRIVRG